MSRLRGKAYLARKRTRMMFICYNLELFEQTKEIDKKTETNSPEGRGRYIQQVSKIGRLAKEHIGYSDSTYTYDIGQSLYRHYLEGKHINYLIYKK